MKTLQELFEMAVRGLASQGWKQSMSADGGCAYRGDNGRRCAIGWCIPDDKYSPDLEGCPAFFESVRDATGTNPCDAQALLGMQRMHDGAFDAENVLHRFINFAANNGFAWPADVPQEIAR